MRSRCDGRTRPNLYTSQALVDFANSVAEHADDNKMGTTNVATVVAPNILRCNSTYCWCSKFSFLNAVRVLRPAGRRKSLRWKRLKSPRK